MRISPRRMQIAAGIGAFVLGSLLIRDAYDKSGVEQPWWFSPFSWW